jgi:hypothetical protein
MRLLATIFLITLFYVILVNPDRPERMWSLSKVITLLVIALITVGIVANPHEGVEVTWAQCIKNLNE